jgi:hypothetical protein
MRCANNIKGALAWYFDIYLKIGFNCMNFCKSKKYMAWNSTWINPYSAKVENMVSSYQC